MEIRTLCDLFYYAVDTHRKPEHLKHKRDGQWRGIGYDEFRTAVEELSLGLRALGIEKGDRVGILSENRPEWAFADLAALTAGAVDVPIYPTLTPAQVLYVLNDSEAEVLFVSTAAQGKKVAEIRGRAKHLKHVIGMDETPIEGSFSLDEVRAKGREALAMDPGAARKRAAEVKPEDLATLIYTSGTTGDPKGVMLLHSNLVSNVEACLKAFPQLTSNDVALSLLPLSHVFERMAGHYLMLRSGVTIAYAEGADKVPTDMLEVRPTIMLSVPRLYEKMYARVQEKVASDAAVHRLIFQWALSVGREVFRHRVERTSPGPLLRLKHALADALVFSRIKERTGGRIRLFVSGGAPLAPEITEFFGAAGLIILEGYGLTETSPVICVNRTDALKPGSVGLPIDGVEVRIAADGEILTRGPHVMKGYFNKPEATAEAIDKEGWLHTGDVGVMDGEGFLTITDRKKDVIVTSGGKKIAPQPIENLIKASKFVAEIVIIGNKHNFAAALVVPAFGALEKWATEKAIAYQGREDLIRKPEVVAHYESLIKELTPDLAQFERIKRITLLTREFSLESGELTPTFKVKRRVVEQKYKDVIDRMYEGPAA